jgi:hypothetical protein
VKESGKGIVVISEILLEVLETRLSRGMVETP